MFGYTYRVPNLLANFISLLLVSGTKEVIKRELARLFGRESHSPSTLSFTRTRLRIGVDVVVLHGVVVGVSNV